MDFLIFILVLNKTFAQKFNILLITFGAISKAFATPIGALFLLK